jgi:hypothetical protein
MNIYFLSFYTEGPEVDGGYDLCSTAKEIKEKLSPYFTEVFIFNKRDLKKIPGSDLFCNSYEEELDMNPNANNIGYFDFKGFLIDKILQKIPENSILIYHDGNFKKNSQYWQSDWENISSLSQKLMEDNSSDLFFQFEREGVYVKEYVKTYTIDLLFSNPIENSIVKDCLLINAARMIMKNTKFTRDFMKEYMDLCENKSLLMKSPNPNPHPDFKWSCGDQDVLNCLVYKYILEGKLPPTFPIYSFLYRIIRLENRPFMWDIYNKVHYTGISSHYNHNLINYIQGINKK